MGRRKGWLGIRSRNDEGGWPDTLAYAIAIEVDRAKLAWVSPSTPEVGCGLLSPHRHAGAARTPTSLRWRRVRFFGGYGRTAVRMLAGRGTIRPPWRTVWDGGTWSRWKAVHLTLVRPGPTSSSAPDWGATKRLTPRLGGLHRVAFFLPRPPGFSRVARIGDGPARLGDGERRFDARAFLAADTCSASAERGSGLDGGGSRIGALAVGAQAALDAAIPLTARRSSWAVRSEQGVVLSLSPTWRPTMRPPGKGLAVPAAWLKGP